MKQKGDHGKRGNDTHTQTGRKTRGMAWKGVEIFSRPARIQIPRVPRCGFVKGRLEHMYDRKRKLQEEEQGARREKKRLRPGGARGVHNSAE